MSSALFSPIQIRQLKLANRIVISPMCQYSSKDGCATDWHLMHVGQFSVSGSGLMIMEMTNVEARGRITPGCMGLYNQQNEDALTRVFDFCREYRNTPIGIQLAHAGRKASTAPPWLGRGALSTQEGGWKTIAPSAIAASKDSPVPAALSKEEVEELIEKFAASARRAERIGFEAIELHGAHGYLIHEFLSPLSNRRDDDYGGSLENRMRFLLSVFDVVRAEIPKHKPVGVRVSATDWVEGGWSIEDTVTLAILLKERGCDWIDVSSGGLVPTEVPAAPGYQVPFSQQIREQTDINTITVGLITQPQQAEEIIASGKADMVALARGMLYDPRWTWHAATALGVDAVYPNQYERASPNYKA